MDITHSVESPLSRIRAELAGGTPRRSEKAMTLDAQLITAVGVLAGGLAALMRAVKAIAMRDHPRRRKAR
jgi:hypothetical protein